KVAGTKVEPLPKLAEDGRLEHGVSRYGSGEMAIHSVRLLSAGGSEAEAVGVGQPLSVSFGYRAQVPLDDAIALVGIYAEDDTCCFETNTVASDVAFVMPEGQVHLNLGRLDLAPGIYHVTVGLF